MPKFDRLRRPLVSSFAGLIIAALAFACSGGDDPTPAPGNGTSDPTGSATGTASSPGTFIFEGKRFEPPFDVTANGREILVDGTVIVRLGGIEGEVPDPDAEVLDAFGLADLAAIAYDEAGGGDEALETARDAIADHAVLGSVTLDAAAGELAIIDTAGFEVFFIPEPPDDAPRRVSEADWEQLASERAAEWNELLADGGLLLLPSAGPSLTVGPAAAEDVVAELDAAMALSGAARESQLIELLADERAVAEVIANYEPAGRASRLPSVDRPSDGQITPIRFTPHPRHDASTIAQAASGISQTPGTPKAWIFATLYNADSQPYTNALISEGYRVSSYDSTSRPFGGLGFAAFVSTSQTGALYLATHGSPRGVSVEEFPTQAAAAAAERAIRAREAQANYYWWRDSSNKWWLAISRAGIQAHWKSNNTIVHAAICRAASLADAFNAREYFSYQPTTSCAVARPDTTLLWQRMTGVQGEGKFRPASVAFAQGGFSAGFRYVDGSTNEDTVVSPGIVEFLAPTLAIGEEGIIVITFDAVLDQGVPAQSLVRVIGCALPTAEATYALVGNLGSPAPGITIPVKANEAGTGSVTVIAANTKSPGKIHLDGNQKPANSNHVAENRDDYVGAVTCVASGIVPSPTTGIQPPTSTATPSGTPDPTEPPPTETPVSVDAVAVGGEDAIVPEGKIVAFFLGGVFYDASGLATVDAHVPFCFYTHVHGGPITPVLPAGGPAVPEHLGECGFGPPNFYLIDRP